MVANHRPKHRDADGAERNSPFRQCALTRSELPTSDLIRFVAGPDNTIYPDIARKLPGRGVWITADRTSVAAAIRARAFSRSLKLKVEVPDNLAEMVESQLIRRTIEALSLANKAGRVVCGFDKVSTRLERERIAVLAHGSDAAKDGRDKLDRKYKAIAAGHGNEAIIIDILTIDEMSLAIGRPNVVHAALIPGGATDRFAGEAEKLARYRAGVSVAALQEAASGAAEGGPP